MDFFPGLVFLGWWPFLFSQEWSYPDLWVINGDPRYAGYKTPIVTHMLLWVVPQDSVVTTWG
jgi:hypothetical protein